MHNYVSENLLAEGVAQRFIKRQPIILVRQGAMKIGSQARLSDLVFYSLIVAVVALYVLIHYQLGLSFPTPWPDEAHFLWQAHAFATNNSLFSEVLNTERTIMWMPPGYLILTGLYFKVVGTSLEAARLLSLLAMAAFFVLLVRFMAHYGHRWFALGLTSLFFFNARFIACGNIARMEALLLLAIVCAFILLQQGRFLYGLLILGLAPLLHLNGIYFGLAGVAFILYQTPLKSLREMLNTRLLVVALLVAVAWIAYGVLIAANWSSFIHDMGFQFRRKGGWDIWLVVTESQYLLLALLVLLGWAKAYSSKIRAIELLFFALPAWLIWPIGHELWYEVIHHTGYLLISMFAIHMWFQLLPASGIAKRGQIKMALTISFIFIVVWWNFRDQRIENMIYYPDRADLVTMGMKHEIPYITSADIALMSELLGSLARDNGSLSVEFQPNGDAFAFLELEQDGVKFVCPVFQKREPDVLVVHRSRHLPTWWAFGDRALDRAGLTKDSSEHIWHERDGTEQWFVVVFSEKVRAGDYYQNRMAYKTKL